LTLWIGGRLPRVGRLHAAAPEAICLEPYTCTTDAINLQQQGLDAGLRVLEPGESWRGIIEMHLSS